MRRLAHEVATETDEDGTIVTIRMDVAAGHDVSR
jgi:hypothetical protein